jgi:UDP-glucose 4-epimerase
MDKNILVTGGAGYIGSHVVRKLINEGYKVSILDNLINGHSRSIPKDASFYKADLGDLASLKNIFDENNYDAVMHFAAFIEAGVSMKKPAEFFANNCVNGFNLLNEMLRHGVKRFIFSSTAAVYGDPVQDLIKENHPLKPVNNYGTTKLMFENILEMYKKSYNLQYIALRYFNASGADESGEIGEDHSPETHLIPLVLKAAMGKIDEIKVFGTDYDTPDGTCVRDYIHVNDLADAHVLALNKLFESEKSDVFNLGNGKGFSVKQVIDSAKKITGKNIHVVETGRREGDPAVLVADSTKAKDVFGWTPKYTSIDDIIKTAWNWHNSYPEGYND